MMFPLVGELAGDGVPVTVTCRVLKLCRPQYYRWLECPVSDAELDEAWLANGSSTRIATIPSSATGFESQGVVCGGPGLRG